MTLRRSVFVGLALAIAGCDWVAARDEACGQLDGGCPAGGGGGGAVGGGGGGGGGGDGGTDAGDVDGGTDGGDVDGGTDGGDVDGGPRDPRYETLSLPGVPRLVGLYDGTGDSSLWLVSTDSHFHVGLLRPTERFAATPTAHSGRAVAAYSDFTPPAATDFLLVVSLPSTSGVMLSRFSGADGQLLGQVGWFMNGAGTFPLDNFIASQWSTNETSSGQAMAAVWSGSGTYEQVWGDAGSPANNSLPSQACPSLAFHDVEVLGQRGGDSALVGVSFGSSCLADGLSGGGAGTWLQRVTSNGNRTSTPVLQPAQVPLKLGATDAGAFIAYAANDTSLSVAGVATSGTGAPTFTSATWTIGVGSDSAVGDVVRAKHRGDLFVTGLGRRFVDAGTAAASLTDEPRTAYLMRLTGQRWVTALGPAQVGSAVPAVLATGPSDEDVLQVMWLLPDAGVAYTRVFAGDGGFVP